jgi:hypothetical protein
MSAKPFTDRLASGRGSLLALACAAASVCATSAHAGGLHLVDPADPLAYAQIQPAIDDALPGDIIVVRPLADPLATYDPIVIESTGTLAIVGVKDLGSVRVAGAQIGDQPLGDAVILRALDFVAPVDQPAVTVESEFGSIRFEDCTLAGGAGDQVAPGAGLIVNNTYSCVAVHCTISGGAAPLGNVALEGAPALSMELSHLSVRGSTLTGGAGADSTASVPEGGSRGGPGSTSHAGTLFFSNCTLTGGTGGLSGCDPLGACDCGPLGDGGDAIAMVDTILTAETCVLVPGLGPEASCGPITGGDPGQEIAATNGVVQVIPDDPHFYEMSSPCQANILATFHFEGVIWEAIYLSASSFPLHKYLYKYDGDLLVGLPDIMDFKFLRLLDSEPAVHDTTHPIPEPPPGLDGYIAYTQAVFVNTLIPGDVHLGDMSVFLYIGYGFPDPPPPPGP